MTSLFIPPVFLYLSILYDKTRTLFFTVDPSDYKVQVKPFFPYPEIVTYIYCIMAIIYLLIYCFRQFRLAKKSSTLLIFTATIILSLMVVPSLLAFFFKKIFNFLPYGAVIAISIICLYLSAVLFSIATFKYRFLNVSAAFQQMLESIKEPVFFIDSLDQIIYYNRSFVELFQWQSKNNLDSLIQKLTSISDETPSLNKIINAIKETAMKPFSAGLSIKQKNELSYFQAVVDPVFSKSGEPLGRVISFHDVTEYQKLTSQLNHRNLEITAMNEELVLKNEQLKEYSAEVAELTIKKERNRFARDTHDTIGHTMTILIARLESLKITCKNNPPMVEQLTAIINTARTGLNEARRSIYGLAPGGLAADNLSQSLKELISGFLPVDVNIDLTVEGSTENCDSVRAEAIYRICQESITNALRHGKATNIHVIVNIETDLVRLFIFDDGLGCKTIHKGLGLTGMETRVRALHGAIKYGTSGENGFVVNVTIPLEKVATPI
jgi:PAS domain S-box-containing protein